MMKVLVTGANGQLGRCLLDRLQAGGDFEFVALDRAELDIVDAFQVDKTLDEFKPDIVINAAAYTAVDRAEEEPELARAVNAQGAENLARSAARLGAILIQVSTDYVFDGKAQRPYKESDETRPAGVYGETKL
ncbi:MAG: NAD(P)-dependent oxidoreductase, partial [Pseudohongiellaceae bacterium]